MTGKKVADVLERAQQERGRLPETITGQWLRVLGPCAGLTEKDLRIPDSGEQTSRKCFTDRLSRHGHSII
jgi:hypothetical protein